MWNKLKKENSMCEQYGAELENLPLRIEGPQAVAELRTYMPVELAEHVENCARCKETGEVFWMTRQLLRPAIRETREELRADGSHGVVCDARDGQHCGARRGDAEGQDGMERRGGAAGVAAGAGVRGVAAVRQHVAVRAAGCCRAK